MQVQEELSFEKTNPPSPIFNIILSCLVSLFATKVFVLKYKIFRTAHYFLSFLQAMQRILSHGFTNRDIKIQDLTPNELSTIINDAATSVMSIVDTCIKNFGRDKVLY